MRNLISVLRISLIVLILSAIAFSPTLGFQEKPEGQETLQKFAKELQRRVSRDQIARRALSRHLEKLKKSGRDTKGDEKLKRLMKRASDTDGENLAWVKKHISNFGFPTVSAIGNKSANEFYLLILHADRDREFQKRCVKKMKEMPSEWPESYTKQLEGRSTSPSIREIEGASTPKSPDQPANNN